MDISQINFEKMGGLVPAVVQDVSTREVLMVGFMNKEALRKTLDTKKITFWSRSKQRLWQKGETSGNVLGLVEMRVDCDQDTILVLVRPSGPTCHKGERSCFGEGSRGPGFLGALSDLIMSRKTKASKNSYTVSLFNEGLDKIIEKVEEESAEVVKAARVETKERLAEESGDLLYHLFVLLAEKEVSFDEVIRVLEKRRK